MKLWRARSCIWHCLLCLFSWQHNEEKNSKVNNQGSISLKELKDAETHLCLCPSPIFLLKSLMSNNKDNNILNCTCHTLPAVYPAARFSGTWSLVDVRNMAFAILVLWTLETMETYSEQYIVRIFCKSWINFRFLLVV